MAVSGPVVTVVQDDKAIVRPPVRGRGRRRRRRPDIPFRPTFTSVVRLSLRMSGCRRRGGVSVSDLEMTMSRSGKAAARRPASSGGPWTINTWKSLRDWRSARTPGRTSSGRRMDGRSGRPVGIGHRLDRGRVDHGGDAQPHRARRDDPAGSDDRLIPGGRLHVGDDDLRRRTQVVDEAPQTRPRAEPQVVGAQRQGVILQQIQGLEGISELDRGSLDPARAAGGPRSGSPGR